MRALGICLLSILVSSCSSRTCEAVLTKKGRSFEKDARIAAFDWLANHDEAANVSRSNCSFDKLRYEPDELSMDLIDSLCATSAGSASLKAANLSGYSRSIYSLRCDCSTQSSPERKAMVFRFNGSGQLLSAVAYSDNVEYKRFLIAGSDL